MLIFVPLMRHFSEILHLFLRLGIIAFGGPAAHIAMIHREVVQKRQWMDEEHFLDLVGATSLIPGPNSTEMVIHCGYQRGGVLGLITSGVSFLLPACLLSGILAALYQQALQIPNFESYLIGIKAVVIILIFQALRKLGKKALKNYELMFVAGFTLILGLADTPEVYALFVATLIGFIILKAKSQRRLMSIEPLSIFYVFAKIGAILFGSGYVLIAYLQDELVHQRGWLTSAQLADAIAIGQLTPGPVLSTSTFVGYLVGGSAGAFAATIGIFLPSFLFVLLLNPLIPKMRASKNLSLLLDSVNAAAVGLIAYAIYPLGKTSLLDWKGALTLVVCGLLLWKWPKLSSIHIVVIGFGIGAGLTQVF